MSSSDPRTRFEPEAECGIKIDRLSPLDPASLILCRFRKDGSIIDFIEIYLEHFMKYRYQVAWLFPDAIARDLYEQSQQMRHIALLHRQKFEEWYVQQPVVIRFTDGAKTYDYRMTYYNWMTGEQELNKILDGRSQVITMEQAKQNTAEEPHVIVDPT